MKDRVIKIISENRPDIEINDETMFIEDGLFDSFDIVTLVSDFDKAFGISIDGVDILPKNFSSINAIVELLKKNGAK